MDTKSIKKLLEKNGWELVRVKGSHNVFKHPERGTLVLPHPKKQLPIGTLKAIEKQSGLRFR